MAFSDIRDFQTIEYRPDKPFHYAKDLEFESCEVLESPLGRFYETSGGLYPSITTTLSKQSNEAINAWTKSIGKKEAEAYTKIITDIGTEFHGHCERYLKNESVFQRELFCPSIEEFKICKPTLDQIQKIYCLEQVLVSHEYRIAGRCDLVADFGDFAPTIVDFKNSRTTDRDFNKYFIQTFFYASAWNETQDEEIEDMLVILATPNKEIRKESAKVKSMKEPFEKMLKEVGHGF